MPTRLFERVALVFAAMILALGLAGCLSSQSEDTRTKAIDPNDPGAWFVQKGCTTCHPVTVYGLWHPAVRAPDLSVAVEDVPRRFGRPLEEFLREPSGTMGIVLGGQITLTPAEREIAVAKLRDAYATYLRAQGAPVQPIASH